MAISLSPTRAYKKRIILTGGLTVEMIRSIISFLDDYHAEIKLAEGLEQELREWKEAVERLEDEVKGKDKDAEKDLKKLKKAISAEMLESIEHVDDLFTYLETISIDDATFIYREMNDIMGFLKLLSHLRIDDAAKYQTSVKFHHILEHMTQALHQFWLASKAQARGYAKLSELTELRSTNKQAKLIRRQAIEARQIANGMDARKKQLVKLVNSDASHKAIHAKLHEISGLYEREFQDLHHIMHYCKVLISRTEKLLHTLEHQAGVFKGTSMQKRVKRVNKGVNRMLRHLQRQSLREYLDIRDHKKSIGNLVEGYAANDNVRKAV
ncbi:MAG: hypothetical protein ACE5DM_01935 [Candidatus Nanoarchaeia archaeon]